MKSRTEVVEVGSTKPAPWGPFSSAKFPGMKLGGGDLRDRRFPPCEFSLIIRFVQKKWPQGQRRGRFAVDQGGSTENGILRGPTLPVPKGPPAAAVTVVGGSSPIGVPVKTRGEGSGRNPPTQGWGAHPGGRGMGVLGIPKLGAKPNYSYPPLGGGGRKRKPELHFPEGPRDELRAEQARVVVLPVAATRQKHIQ